MKQHFFIILELSMPTRMSIDRNNQASSKTGPRQYLKIFIEVPNMLWKVAQRRRKAIVFPQQSLFLLIFPV